MSGNNPLITVKQVSQGTTSSVSQGVMCVQRRAVHQLTKSL